MNNVSLIKIIIHSRSSISIACWVFVYSPQLIENFRRSSADGLSLAFLITWLLGDLSNVLGAILQGVLPTMTILAIYYVAADFVLLGQWFYYYHGSGPSGRSAEERLTELPTEQSSLLRHETADDLDGLSRRGFVDVENPTAPSKLTGPPLVGASCISLPTTHAPALSSSFTSSISGMMISALYKISIVVLVCFVGVMGWYISSRSPHTHNGLSSLETKISHSKPSQDETLHLNLWGQFFGYLCAAFYLGSRVPQLLLNHSRKSTEGVSILFFIFCCLGNVTYTLSIFAYEPRCAGEEKVHHHRPLPGGKCEQGDWERAYWKYIVVDASWVIGSIGALVLDLAIFSQFWLYRGRKR